jgi:exocyst complex component 4
VYRPVLQFTDKVVSLLPKKYSQLGNDGLQSFIENFVKDQFLPIVYVDYRTRVADALASPSAFRLKAHPGAVYESSVEACRPILQGPLAANHLITEVFPA